MMHSNDNEQAGELRSAPLHLFEVSFAAWGLPVTVIAEDPKTAISMAIEYQGGMVDARSVLVWDASDAWSGMCQIRQWHTDRALADGTIGIAQYDDEEGWLVTPSSPR